MKTIQWTVRGINWKYKFLGTKADCPMELATKAIEILWNNEPTDLWKALEEGKEDLEIATDSEPALGIVIIVENSTMKSKEEHFVVSAPIVLANAGLYSESDRIQKEWDKVAEEDKIASLLNFLGKDNTDLL